MKVANRYVRQRNGAVVAPRERSRGHAAATRRTGETTRRRGCTRRTRAAGSCRSGRRCGRLPPITAALFQTWWARSGSMPTMPPPAPALTSRVLRVGVDGAGVEADLRPHHQLGAAVPAIRRSRPQRAHRRPGIARAARPRPRSAARARRRGSAPLAARRRRDERTRPNGAASDQRDQRRAHHPDGRPALPGAGLDGVVDRAVHHRLQRGEQSSGPPSSAICTSGNTGISATPV